MRSSVTVMLMAAVLAHAAALRPQGQRKPAPELALKDADGKKVLLSELRGKVVLVDFWATWCLPCKLEMPWFMDMQKTYQAKGFEVIGASMDDEGWDVVKKFISDMGVNYRVVIGTEAVAKSYSELDPNLKPNLDMLPTTFLIDRQGRVAAIHEGLTSKQDFIDEIEGLLAEPK